jgi:hypothetical protein
MMQKSTAFTTIFRVKSATFTTILRVKKCHFHYDMQKKYVYYYFLHYLKLHCLIVNYAKPSDHIGNCAKEYVGTGLETCI